MTEPSRLEQEVAGIREALNELLKNHLPTLNKRLVKAEERGAFHTTLILGVYAATFAGAIAVIITVLVK
jgi:hypothetical protein